MHFHADHSLYFERRSSVARASAAIAVTVAILVVNSSAGSTVVSLSGAGIGAFALVLARVRGAGRIEPILAWVLAVVGLSAVAGVGLGADTNALARTGSRVVCGAVWILWLGTEVDWVSLRQILISFKVPDGIISSLDHAMMHGMFTKREWVQRRDAARLRLGTKRLTLGTWGPLLGEGALHAFARLEQAEENATVRSATIGENESSECIELTAIDVERDGTRVLSGLDLRVEPGEWLLLCGPSGAGKSSLLRLLAGLDEPVQGSMSRLGVNIRPGSDLTDRLDGRVVLLTQNPEHHFVASTVAEDIAWGLLRRGIEESEALSRSRELAKSLGIERLLERPCHQLSFGEQRRVALAGLLVLEPAVMLLDEPTSGLDPVAANDLRKLVQQSVQETGAACIWATHDLHAVPPEIERVVLLRDGEVVFDGPSNQGLSNSWLCRAGLAVEQ